MLNEKQHEGAIKAVFRIEATPELGLGHLMRCLALAEKFKESISNVNITFIASNNALNEQIKGYNYKLINLPSFKDIIEEGEYYTRYFKKTIFITDIPDVSQSYLKTLRKGDCLFVNIDDGSGSMFYSDILISPNLNPNTNHKYSSNTRYYAGAKYIILDKAFEKYAPEKKQIRRKVESIFVCFGGNDRNNITQTVINMIWDIDISILIIVGIMYPYYNTLARNTKEHKNIRIKVNVHNIDELVSDADMAVISGGTLLYETSAVGTPAIIICQNREQNKESELFAENNAAINLGTFGNINKGIVRNAILRLISDYDKRKLLSKNAKQLIDGRGTDRIVKIILKEYLERQAKWGPQ